MTNSADRKEDAEGEAEETIAGSSSGRSDARAARQERSRFDLKASDPTLGRSSVRPAGRADLRVGLEVPRLAWNRQVLSDVCTCACLRERERENVCVRVVLRACLKFAQTRLDSDACSRACYAMLVCV